MRFHGYVMGLWVAVVATLPGTNAAYAKDCVKAVRSMSHFDIQGDAWTWWQHSEGHYGHDDQPKLGSVLVFKKTGKLSRGHVSLVSKLVDDRTIEVDHTWLRSGQIRKGMTVIDVSADNDWSEVRVWNEPTDQMGQHVYPTYGFVLPKGRQIGHQSILVAGNDDDDSDDQQSAVSIAPASRPTLHIEATERRHGKREVETAHLRGHGSAKSGHGHVVMAKAEAKGKGHSTVAKLEGHGKKGHVVVVAKNETHGKGRVMIVPAAVQHGKPAAGKAVVVPAKAHQQAPVHKRVTMASAAKPAHKPKEQVASK